MVSPLLWNRTIGHLDRVVICLIFILLKKMWCYPTEIASAMCSSVLIPSEYYNLLQ